MKTAKGIGGHQSAKTKTNTWLTPPDIIKSLGGFDLDPCTPLHMPWETAKARYTIIDNGLTSPWYGRVWLNPPYNREEIGLWLLKMAEHFNGIALTFARTETKAFQDHVFPSATSILFLSGRLTFLDELGKKAPANGGAPSVLISYGELNADAISDSGIEGKHMLVNAIPTITISQSPDWRSVVSISLIQLNGSAPLNDIYEMVARIAPDKVAKNKHYEEKIRQKLQRYFKPLNRGVWSLNLS